MVIGGMELSSAPAEKRLPTADGKPELPARALPQRAALILPTVPHHVDNPEDAAGAAAILA